MSYSSFRNAIPVLVTGVCLQILPGCGPDVGGGGSGGSGGTGNGAGGSTGMTTGGSGGATGAGGSTDGGLTCAERAMSAIEQVDAVLKVHLTCTTDADCTTVDVSTACGGDCPKAVNMEGATAVQAAVADVNSTVCDGYEEDGCPYATPGCAAPTGVTCVAGTCTLMF